MSQRNAYPFRSVLSRYLQVAVVGFVGMLCTTRTAVAQNTLTAAEQTKVDAIAQQVLAQTGVPSASIGIVKDGRVAYLKAYGEAELHPPVAAQPQMRYSIGSISKQFTAAAILMLQQQGKLSLDDTVSKWLPALTSANRVTLREVLSHTSGYQDYYAEDYTMPPMLQPTTADAIQQF